MSTMNLVLMGLPGASKGTQAQLIVKDFDIPHISTGDIFRAAIKNQTPMGVEAKKFIDKGELVPDEVTNGIVQERLAQDDTKDGFMLDGFPRNIFQAEYLDKYLSENNISLDKVINIEVDPKLLVERACGRRICKTCGATYHVKFNPSKEEGVCDSCHANLTQRPDDNEETVSHRIDVYLSETKPLVDYYTKQNVIANIEGNQDIDKVFEDIKAALA